MLNAPVAGAFDPSVAHSVRAQAGLADDIPLAVYSGGMHESRGVMTLIQALPLVPEVHLAIVASSPHSARVVDVLAEAERLGRADRVHLVPYVSPEEVSSYLRTADVGVHPLLRSGNAELALPNKLFEYLHARLPMVVSDMPSMADMVSTAGARWSRRGWRRPCAGSSRTRAPTPLLWKNRRRATGSHGRGRSRRWCGPTTVGSLTKPPEKPSPLAYMTVSAHRSQLQIATRLGPTVRG